MRKYNSKITKEQRMERIEDSRYLKQGDIIAIAKAVGCTHQAVHFFIKGYSNSKRISLAFNQFVKQRKATLQEGIKKNLV